MTRINAYLHFAGTCREAMTFYKECIGGELVMQKVGETAMAGQMPPEEKEKVMHAVLTKVPLVLMGSDMTDPEHSKQGNISLMLDCSSEEEINSFFSKLSKGGKVNHPLKEEFWGSVYGDFIDKFGMRWMLNWDKPKA